MRLIYEKDGKFFKSESGIPEKDGVEVGLTREQVEGYALVYAKDGEIRASETGIPAEDDVVLYPVAEVEEDEEDEPVAKEEETPAEGTGDGPTYDLPAFEEEEEE
jgi:hypothetical protein